MSRNAAFTFRIVFTAIAAVLLYCGIQWTPDNLPATAANFLLPGPLVFVAGCLALAMGSICTAVAE